MTSEHSWCDGTTGVFFAQMTRQDLMNNPVVGPDTEHGGSANVNRVGE